MNNGRRLIIGFEFFTDTRVDQDLLKQFPRLGVDDIKDLFACLHLYARWERPRPATTSR